MATGTRYAETEDFVSRMDIPDAADDFKASSALDAASRAIDNYCGQRFYTTDSDETFYYTAEFGDVLFLDDPIVSITTLKTDDDGDRTWGTTWATTDYDLMPFNASSKDHPYTWIEVTPEGDYVFVTIAKGVEIVGKFGWPEVPAPITEATMLIAAKLFKRKDAIFGVMGVSELGIIQKIIQQDDELMLMLAPYKRHV